MAVLRDLAEVTHWISVVKIARVGRRSDGRSRRAGARPRLAERLGMRTLTRAWQMLLKALEEVAAAPNAMMAAEMALIRLTHVADLPTPEELVRRLGEAPTPAAGPQPVAAAAPPRRGPSGAAPAVSAVPTAAPAPVPVAAPERPAPLARYRRFEDVVALIREKRDMQLLVEVEAGVRLVHFAPGRIEFEPAENAAADLASRLAQRLQAWTGERWGVSVVGSGGAATVAERRGAERDDLAARAMAHPLVQAVLAAFPGAEIRDIRQPGAGRGGRAPGRRRRHLRRGLGSRRPVCRGDVRC
jgi:DNA polymerase III subunit gamma/tau